MSGTKLLVAALGARGLRESDVSILIDSAARARGGFGIDEPLLAFLGSRLDEDELQRLIETVAEAASRGPRTEPFASTWRELYSAGCPYDRLWRNLYHACNDPSSDPQDRAWLSLARCRENAQRAIALGFPFRECPSWPGIGCQVMIESANAGVVELLGLDAPHALVVQNLRWARQAVSDSIAAAADAAAVVGDDSFDGDADDWLERIDAERWFAALRELLAGPTVVRDPVVDRFCFEFERSLMVAHAPRPTPSAPSEPHPAVLAMLERNRRWDPVPWNYVAIDELDWMDPIRWLERAAEDLIVEAYDPERLVPTLRAPRT